MQKALTQMNVQLANAISDISGAAGQAIIGAILEGERDTRVLAELRDPGIKASETSSCRRTTQRAEVLRSAQRTIPDDGSGPDGQQDQLRRDLCVDPTFCPLKPLISK